MREAVSRVDSFDLAVAREKEEEGEEVAGRGRQCLILEGAR